MTKKVDWSEKGMRQRGLALVYEICPRRQRIKAAVEEGDWEQVMQEVKCLPQDIGREFCRRFFAPLPHGQEVGNFIADLLYKIPWLKPQGDPSKLKAKLRKLGRQFQVRLQPFGLEKPLPVQIIEKDWVAAVWAYAAWYVVAGYAVEDATRGAGRRWGRRGAVRNVASDMAGYVAGYAVEDATRGAGRRLGQEGAVRNVASDMAGYVAWLIDQDQPQLQGIKSPFESITKIWALGAWPIGFVGDGEKATFTIFLPPVRQARQ